VPQARIQETGIEQVDIGVQIILGLISIIASAIAVLLLIQRLQAPVQKA